MAPLGFQTTTSTVQSTFRSRATRQLMAGLAVSNKPISVPTRRASVCLKDDRLRVHNLLGTSFNRNLKTKFVTNELIAERQVKN